LINGGPVGLLWGLAAVALVVVEMFTMEFTCLSLAFGCLMGAGAGALGLPVWAQFAAAIVGAVVGLAGLAPVLRRRLSPAYVATGVDAIPGSEAMVVEAIEPPHQGKVKLNGVVWQATSNLAIPAGTPVIVTEVEGACLTVLARGALMSSQTSADPSL
jgi:membrane protein implicated in regulation of membrane protease activity